MNKILIVEDEADIRHGFDKLLKSYNCIREKARNVSDALTFLDDFQFDLIILDLQLSPENREGGFHIIRKIKTMRFNRATPVVIISGKMSKEQIERRITPDDNVVDILMKPVTNEELLGAIRKVLDLE